MIQFIQSISTPVTKDHLHLFQLEENQEGAILFSQLSKICGLRTSLRKLKGIQENIHYFILEGKNLQSLRQKNQEQITLRGHRLLFLTESGVAFLISHYLQKATLRWGAWLFSSFFLHLPGRCSENYHTTFYSQILNREIKIYMIQGRLAFSLEQVIQGSAINVDPIFHAYCGLIPSVDWVGSNSEKVNYLYLSGLYRIWQQYPQLYIWKKAYEEEVCHVVYQSDVKWLQQEIIVDQVKESPYFFSATRATTWQEILQRVKDVQQSIKCLVEKQNFAKHDEQNQGKENKVSLANVTQIAKSLGLFYSDQKTPHLVFMRHLLETTTIKNLTKLKQYLRETLQFSQGINEYDYQGTSFRIWWEL